MEPVITDTVSQPPKYEVKRRKTYKLATFITEENGRLLEQLAANLGVTKTAWLEMTIREHARREGIS